METLYGLKRKTTNRWLKLLLLLFVAVGFGIPNLNAQTKAIKVADNQQLVEAMTNSPMGTTVELSAGYYTYLNKYVESGTKLVKGGSPDGNRDFQCQYFTIGQNVCFNPIPPETLVLNTAQAGYSDPFLCGCCPGPGPNSDLGRWSCHGQPAGSTVVFYDTTFQTMDFWVDTPGAYLMRYTWGEPFNSLVETQYYFYTQPVVELSADDVCGLTTEVRFIKTSAFPDPLTTTIWTLNGEPYPGPTASDTFNLTVPECGLYDLEVEVIPTRCEPAEAEVIIDFSCQPIADAGPDVNICDALCYYSLVGSIGLDEDDLSPTYSWTWVQIDGPPGGELIFDDPDDLITGVCATDVLDDCPYGQYEVEFQVQNGQCDSVDEMDLRFYEMPLAIAGPDQNLCNTFSFNLAAVPFEYCGEEGVNYWSHSWWTLVSQPGTCEVAFDEFDPDADVEITNCGESCAYGPYVFVWNELNVMIEDGDTLWSESHCYSSDEIVVNIFEDPVVDAGEDMIFCNTFAFSLFAVADEPCYENTVVVYSWEKTAEPGNCLVTFVEPDDLDPDVFITNCDPTLCEYGKYIFTFTQSNGYLDETENFVSVCSTSDDVVVWDFEEPDAEAGEDQHICDAFTFTLEATPTIFCGEPIVDGEGNYNTFGEWEFLSGPAVASFVDEHAYLTDVTIDITGVECPYGMYAFVWTEFNGFGEDDIDLIQGCWDSDTVYIFIDEVPESVNAGPDQEYCETFDFLLDGTLDLPCTQGTAYSFTWTLIQQPDDCDVLFGSVPGVPTDIDPLVSITDCEGCPYGEYIFRLTQLNGYLDDAGAFVTVCSSFDDVSVWIYQEPEPGELTGPGNLCNTFEFDLSAVGSDYCGYHNNWYSWTLVSQPDDCEVNITNGTTTDASIAIGPCTGECPYGEYVFQFSEFDGSENVYCEDSELISVFIFEQPDAEAGDDVHACVDLAFSPFCYDLSANLEYCYSMQGVWSKSCGPGDVLFSDINDPLAEVCIPAPGRYIFVWTLSNDACEDSDEIMFDLLEQPVASAEDTDLLGECDELCIDLGLADVEEYEYFGTSEGTCPNFWDRGHWTYVSGPTGDPLEVSFADDTDPETELCVSTFGCYTVRWNEVNKPDDQDYFCSAYVDIFVQFVETPDAEAGEDVSVCASCYTMQAVPSIPDVNNCPPSENQSFWTFIEYIPPVPFCDANIEYSACAVFSPNDPNGQLCVCDDYYGSHYGTYVFTWTEINGPCTDVDTVSITMNKTPDEVPLEGCIMNENCNGMFQGGPERDVANCGCVESWYPEDGVFTVCANTCGYMQIDWDALGYLPIPGYTYEWSFTGPAGSSFNASPYYYDCECGWVGSPNVYLCFGVCCDTARLYLTITTPEGCVTTEEWKFYVQHPPDATIIGPEVAEVGDVFEYSITDPENPCYLYTWDVQHCGEIVYGQGTGTIGVLWTDYNVNGGWGLITVGVYDTCTCCCSTDELLVKVYPQNTLGEATLAGHVYYHNSGTTPLDGVEIQLWNSGIPVMSTFSFNDIEGGNGVGYFEFPGINGSTNFGVTASYDAPWYGANATDALAVQLEVINALPGGFVFDNVVSEAMDVNNSNTISATDALWIKQRAINMVNYFPAGDWVFDPTMTASAGSSPYDIYTLNAGDANRSNIPNSMKTTPAIDLVTDGTMNVATGQVFELPIRIADASQFGAITLNLGYNPSVIEVVEIVPMDGMIDNISDGNISIAWSSVNPMNLTENEVVVILKVKAISPITSTESLFTIGMNSEFADANATVIAPVTLKTYGVTTGPAATDYFLSANRPNPFSTSTFIEYTMPESGKVKLSVLDMLGQEMAVLVDATQSAGSYQVTFSAAGLATGVYIYKITVDGETRDYISTQRMVISH